MSFLLVILAAILYRMKYPLSLPAYYSRRSRQLLLVFLIILSHLHLQAQWTDALTNDGNRGALYTTGGDLKAGMAAADLDGDGKADLITTNLTRNVISVFRNTSTQG